MKVVCYSAIYGNGYDTPKPVYGVGAGTKCVMFTDIPNLQAPGWEVRYEPLARFATPMLRAKYWKCHPHLAVPQADVSIWIDGSITPKENFAAHCVRALGKDDVAFTPHPIRDCIYAELDASIPLPKYNARTMIRQVQTYREMGHPEHWGLFASGIMARRNKQAVNRLNIRWWGENWFWSWQDQLSLPVVTRAATDVSWNMNLPWAEHWDYAEHHT